MGRKNHPPSMQPMRSPNQIPKDQLIRRMEDGLKAAGLEGMAPKIIAAIEKGRPITGTDLRTLQAHRLSPANIQNQYEREVTAADREVERLRAVAAAGRNAERRRAEREAVLEREQAEIDAGIEAREALAELGY